MLKKIVKHMVPDNIIDYIKTIRKAIAIARKKIDERKRLQKSAEYFKKIINSPNKIMLDLGAGEKKGTNGWTTVDINRHCDIYWDLNFPLPIPDNSVDIIYNSHVLEHFFYPDLMRFLADCYRVLKFDGKFSVCVPNSRIYLNSYFDENNFDAKKYCLYEPAFFYNSKIDYVNYIAYMAGHHRYMFDEENLLLVMENAGFRNVRFRNFDPNHDKIERDYESIYAEGEK